MQSFSGLFRTNNFGKALPIQFIKKIIVLNGVGKYAIALHSCISVIDKVIKNNNQTISIAVEPLYIHIEFEVI